MRTTITLDPDVESLLKAAMQQRGISFKAAVNDAIRAGLSPRSRKPFRQRTFSLGERPAINYDKALAMAAALEDEELARKLATGK
jgi:hypothetical protein